MSRAATGRPSQSPLRHAPGEPRPRWSPRPGSCSSNAGTRPPRSRPSASFPTPPADRVPVVLLQARDPPGRARRLDRRRRRGGRDGGPAAGPLPRREPGPAGHADRLCSAGRRADGTHRAGAPRPGRGGTIRPRRRRGTRRDSAAASRRPAPHHPLTGRAGALRLGLKEREAADIVHALASPEVYRLLVTDRGWSGKRYQQWLSSILIDQLLPATTTR